MRPHALEEVTGAAPEDLGQAFVELADSLVTDFDSADLMHRLTEHCVELLTVDAAGLLLAEPAGERPSLRLVASSTEHARVLDLFQLQEERGPSLECYRTGEVVSALIDDVRRRWPRFATAAEELGFAEVHAVPMRLREQVLGSLNLFRSTPGLAATDLRVARALADVATIGLVQERTLRRHETLSDQLQIALNSRVSIEQAKGVIAEGLGPGVEEAFAALRGHGRRHGRRLKDVAQSVVDGSLQLDDLRTLPRR